MEELVNQIVAKCDFIKAEIQKGTAAANTRTRKATLDLEKLGKEFRRKSIASDEEKRKERKAK